MLKSTYRYKKFVSLFCLALLLVASARHTRAQEPSRAPDFKIYHGASPRMAGLKPALPKYVQVFGLYFHATEKVPDGKLLHAANIAAEYLDNDLDGKPDNPKVNQALWDRRASMVMVYNDREIERLFDRFGELFDEFALQDLHAVETLPNGGPHKPAANEFDATMEEVLHIITSTGYANVYPEVFGENRGTELAKAMDSARGGYFRTVPRRYPARAWYSYDDRTCDYGCQVTEYVYWALTSLLDGQNFGDRGQNISNEWRLNTPQKLKDGDKAVVKILTDPRYNLPTRLPDGKYQQKVKRAALNLRILPDLDAQETEWVITANLPTEAGAVLESTHDFKEWTLARLIPNESTEFQIPVRPAAQEAMFFRLRLGE